VCDFYFRKTEINDKCIIYMFVILKSEIKHMLHSLNSM